MLLDLNVEACDLFNHVTDPGIERQNTRMTVFEPLDVRRKSGLLSVLFTCVARAFLDFDLVQFF